MAGGKRGSKSAAAAKAPEGRKKESEQEKLSEQDVYDIDFELDSPQEGKLDYYILYRLFSSHCRPYR